MDLKVTVVEIKGHKFGLAGKKDSSKAYIQCPDPYEYTGGGTVIFEIEKVD